MLLFVKREVHCCDCLQFLVHFHSEGLSIGSFNFNFSSQYIFWDSHRAVLAISRIILPFCATNFVSCSGAINHDYLLA